MPGAPSAARPRCRSGGGFIHLDLIRQVELFLIDRLAPVDFQRGALRNRRLHCRIEEAQGVAPAALAWYMAVSAGAATPRP